MKELRPEQFSAQLKSPLKEIYILAGLEPLLVLEATQALIRTAQQQGFSEREILHVEPGFDWSQVQHAGEHLSLFASRRIIELHLPENGPGREGSKALTDYAKAAHPDTLLIIHIAPAATKIRKAAWYKKLGQQGMAMFAWPVEPQQLPRWISKRAQKKGLRLTDSACQLLARLTEGHLLACAQEIDRLALLFHGQGVDEATLEQIASDQARFNMFDIPEKALTGDLQGALKSLERLWEEGVDDVPILWSLANETRLLYRTCAASKKGQADALLKTVFMPPKRKKQIKQAALRADLGHLQQLLTHAARADRIAKGAQPGRVRDELITLTLGLAGQTILTPQISPDLRQ